MKIGDITVGDRLRIFSLSEMKEEYGEDDQESFYTAYGDDTDDGLSRYCGKVITVQKISNNSAICVHMEGDKDYQTAIFYHNEMEPYVPVISLKGVYNYT